MPRELPTGLDVTQPNLTLDAYRRAIADAYWLTGLLSQLLDDALVDLADARAELAALTARVTALEPPTDPLEEISG